MRSLQRSSTATKAALALAGLLVAGIAFAQPPAGIVTRLEGPLLAQKANGRTRVIAQGAPVEVGDTLFTGNGTYAEIVFADDSNVALRPGTQLAIEAFPADASKADDEARFVLLEGGMRVTSGRLAARGINHHSIDTPFGTIAVTPSKFTVAVTPGAATPVAGERRVYLAASSSGTMSDAPQPIIVATTFINHYVPPPPSDPTKAGAGATTTLPPPKSGTGTPPAPPGTGTASAGVGTAPPPGPLGPSDNGGGFRATPVSPPPLSPGLHLSVTDGAIIVTNNGGSQGFQAGQFGYVPGANQPPVIVPGNPNIQFVPPPSFNSGSGGPTASNGPGQGQATDCIVR